MRRHIIVFGLIGILISGILSLQTASAQFGIAEGGVDIDGEWYVGEGLKQGDYFSYRLCHVDYKECSNFQIEFWIEGDITSGPEIKWLSQVLVKDRVYVIPGTMELGKIAPEPTGGSAELGPYRSAFKTSLAWLSAFATADIGVGKEGPKQFRAPSWGKIANIGGEQIVPTDLKTIAVPAGTFETVLVTWKTGGAVSQVWIKDGFPFPIKAETWTHVSEGIPPPEYQFQLLNYKENVQTNPFAGITPNLPGTVKEGCPKNFELVDIKKSTNDFTYLLDIKYGPSNPSPGCEIDWNISFKNKFDETEFLNQVQYDIWVVDDNFTTPPLRSIADDEGRNFLYSHSGQVVRSTIVNENPGTAHYVIWIYGLAPEYTFPTTGQDFLSIDIPISGTPIISPPTPTSPEIPSWIKNNAGWWSSGQIDDDSFVQGIQWLIKEGIMKIPETQQGTGSGSNEIPDWIRNNADWWNEGLISDNDFVQGIQWLIENGIMRIA